jgi:organic radical activating enzyme
MKKLRLILFTDCNRNCAGCCNKQWDINTLPVVSLENLDLFYECDEIILTGGEPMINLDCLFSVINAVKSIPSNSFKDRKVYLYTALVDDITNVLSVLDKIDGICVTLHDQDDVIPFIKLNDVLALNMINLNNKSLRLNIFDGIKINKTNLNRWKIKENIKWIENCPLPENETLAILDKEYI